MSTYDVMLALAGRKCWCNDPLNEVRRVSGTAAYAAYHIYDDGIFSHIVRPEIHCPLCHEDFVLHSSLVYHECPGKAGAPEAVSEAGTGETS